MIAKSSKMRRFFPMYPQISTCLFSNFSHTKSGVRQLHSKLCFLSQAFSSVLCHRQGHAATFLTFSKEKKKGKELQWAGDIFLFAIKNFTVKPCFSIILRARSIQEYPLMLICVSAPSGLSANCTCQSMTAHLPELPFRIKGKQIIRR